MNDTRRFFAGVVAWLLAITGLHGWLNIDWAAAFNDFLPEAERKLHVAYIPVT
jgi:NitT/TauT family transport system substrate-binding protein